MTKKYKVLYSNTFKKNLKKIIKQGKDLRKLDKIVLMLASESELEPKYKDHALNDNKYFKNCRDIHIEPDWILVYKYINDEYILLLVTMGSHSDLF